mgnify:CR=1 FL=1
MDRGGGVSGKAEGMSVVWGEQQSPHMHALRTCFVFFFFFREKSVQLDSQSKQALFCPKVTRNWPIKS